MVARLDLAAKLYHAAQAPKPRIICLSGGTPHKPNPRDARGFDSKESTASARYLISEHDVPPADVLEEAFSLDTIGNAYFLRVWHTDVAGYRSLLVVNNAFHLPRTRAIFDHVFSLPAAPGAAAPDYALTYAEAPNALPPDVEAARVQREAKSLAAYAKTAARVATLADMHDFLFFDHGAYATKRLLDPPKPLDAAALKSY